ncbi:MAG: prepilin-type N-terminal cleavage/methylation domain-containing protein [Phycisphaerae bacterium]|nr:prepilin-type N-terminal cleavage/methylation domain-containing protein [Phycisphaerae bacterium]
MNKKGFTLIELMITMTAMVIVLMALGLVLVDNFRNYSVMHKRMYAGPVTDAYISQQVFDKMIRQSYSKRPLAGYVSDTEITVYYYEHPEDDTLSPKIDRYAYFHIEDGNLVVDYGPVTPPFDPLVPPDPITLGSSDRKFILAQDVTSVNFSVDGAAVTMVLTIDNKVNDNTKKEPAITVSVTAFRNN